jgi:CRP/FNR family transcriptional regulator
MTATAPRVCTWYIRHVDVFRHLTPRDGEALAHAMTLRRFTAGQLIIDRETMPELVYLLRSGSVRLFHREDDGRESTVERLGEGHLFGVTALLTTDAGGILAQADTDVEVCIADGRRFLYVVSKWPQALLELALGLGLRVRESDEVLGRMTPTGARARLAAVLHQLATNGVETQPGGGVRLRSVPRHAELANQIGATRETVTRMLARLESDGYIRRFGRQIVLPDVQRLRDDFDLSQEGPHSGR